MATTRTRIGPADHGRRMSLEEFREAEEQPGYLYELARGVLGGVEVPGDDHGQVVHNLQEALSRYNARHPGAILRIGHGSDIRLVIAASDSDRHPDLGVVFRNAPRDERDCRRAALVIEVVSPGAEARRRDLVEKREDYLSFGVPEYWIVDPELRQVTTLVRHGEGEGAAAAWSERAYRGEETIASECLPGFDGTVSELWLNLEADEG
jgi:Uma2 family endonuclease